MGQIEYEAGQALAVKLMLEDWRSRRRHFPGTPWDPTDAQLDVVVVAATDYAMKLSDRVGGNVYLVVPDDGVRLIHAALDKISLQAAMEIASGVDCAATVAAVEHLKDLLPAKEDGDGSA